VSWPAKGSGGETVRPALRPLALEEKPASKALLDLIERMTTGMAMTAKFTLFPGEPESFSSEWETHLRCDACGKKRSRMPIRHAEAQKIPCAP